jgi:hypothetical protein
LSETKKQEKYLSIVSHYEECLERHGDTHLGVDWPNKQGAETRYQVRSKGAAWIGCDAVD